MSKDLMLQTNGFLGVNTAAYTGLDKQSRQTPTSMMNSTGGFAANERFNAKMDVNR